METVEFVFNRSSALTALFTVLYGGAVVIWLSLDFTPYLTIPMPFSLIITLTLKMTGGIMLSFLGWQAVRLQAWKQDPRSVILLRQDSKGRWSGQTKAGQTYLLSLLNDSFIGTHWLILRFSSKTKTVNLLIFKDMLTPSEYRILRNRLVFY
jgi:hypothetical protein